MSASSGPVSYVSVSHSVISSSTFSLALACAHPRSHLRSLAHIHTRTLVCVSQFTSSAPYVSASFECMSYVSVSDSVISSASYAFALVSVCVTIHGFCAICVCVISICVIHVCVSLCDFVSHILICARKCRKCVCHNSRVLCHICLRHQCLCHTCLCVTLWLH